MKVRKCWTILMKVVDICYQYIWLLSSFSMFVHLLSISVPLHASSHPFGKPEERITMRTHTHTHKHTQTHTQTQTHKHIQTHTHTHKEKKIPRFFCCNLRMVR